MSKGIQTLKSCGKYIRINLIIQNDRDAILKIYLQDLNGVIGKYIISQGRNRLYAKNYWMEERF